MDALDLLEQQHRDVCALLSRLVEASPVGAGSEEAFYAALRAVEAHVRVEEAYVYIACASRLGDDTRVREAREEHTRILDAARIALAMSRSAPQFAAVIAALRERFEKHADVEEDVVFPKLKRSLTDEELDVLGEEIERSYNRLLAGADETRTLKTRPSEDASRAEPRMRRGIRGPAPRGAI
ncbi:hemerythrin domain-containing protein [Polyangium mundeleinium]|uniref:Hemerythrin domain-containing protein n=1 Tax=Polyangium mundeleinium TaxID=2995306 RepID=A0ABT5EVA5_9BACT|nr:hemerythrin domain-containing protein [Polyangium mundeleinium]MDC0745757.1 hemerythrin domain-containing protein [Polyangium mundeleinium]